MDAKQAVELLDDHHNWEPGTAWEIAIFIEQQAALIQRQEREIARLDGQHVFDNSQLVEYEGIIRTQATRLSAAASDLTHERMQKEAIFAQLQNEARINVELRREIMELRRGEGKAE